MRAARRFDSPLAAGLIAAALYALFAYALWETRGRDVSRFVVAGGALIDAANVPPGLTITPGIEGYDGLAFYRLALDPFTRDRTANGITLDNPPYRHQRIGYPLLVWALSGGVATRVPALLVLVNVVAAAAIAAGGAAIAGQLGLHALWGLGFALYPGFLLSLSRDTSEVVACAFLVLAIAALGRRAHGVGAALLVCAVLTRETTLIFALAAGAAWLVARMKRCEPVVPLWVAVLPLAVYVLWQGVLRLHWGIAPIEATSPGWTVPFSEYVRVFVAALPRRARWQRLYLAECVYLAILVVAAAAAMVRGKAALPWRLAFVAALALGATLPRDVWAEDFAFLRVLADLSVAAMAVVLGARSGAIRAAVVTATAALWLYLAQVTLNL